MARSKEKYTLDGFDTVNALRRSGKGGKLPRTRPSSTKLSTPKTTSTKEIKHAKRIGRTVIPEKHEIVCYECDYKFSLAGRIQKAICPKCHCTLEKNDIALNGKRTKPVKTIGAVHIKPNAVISGGMIKARDVIISGDARDTIITAFQKLVLCKGAKFDISKVNAKDIQIESGGRFTIRRKLAFRNIDIAGSINATIYVDKTAIIRSSGLLEGEIHTPNLIVEEGGGLKATVVAGIIKGRREET